MLRYSFCIFFSTKQYLRLSLLLSYPPLSLGPYSMVVNVSQRTDSTQPSLLGHPLWAGVLDLDVGLDHFLGPLAIFTWYRFVLASLHPRQDPSQEVL